MQETVLFLSQIPVLLGLLRSDCCIFSVQITGLILAAGIKYLYSQIGVVADRIEFLFLNRSRDCGLVLVR
jgi:hypothetical protein